MSKIENLNKDGTLYSFVEQQIKSGVSMSKISESLCVDRHYLTRFMKENGFSVKRKTIFTWANENGIQDIGLWLENEYVKNKRSSNDIARQIGISNVAVLKWMNRAGIVVRDYSDAKIAHLQNMSDEERNEYIRNTTIKTRKTISLRTPEENESIRKKISESGIAFWSNVSEEYMAKKRNMGRYIAEKRLKNWSDKQKQDCLARLQAGKERRLAKMTESEKKEMVKKAYSAHWNKFNSDREYREMCIHNTMVGQNGRESKPEKEIKEKLLELGCCDFVDQYQIDRFSIDIAFPDVKLAVEIDGEYWHNLEKTKERDARKNKLLEDKGWHLMRFPASKVYKDPESYAWNVAQSYESIRIATD